MNRKLKIGAIALGILLVILILMLLGALPTWPHSRSWGYGPSGIVGVILLVLTLSQNLINTVAPISRQINQVGEIDASAERL